MFTHPEEMRNRPARGGEPHSSHQSRTAPHQQLPRQLKAQGPALSSPLWQKRAAPPRRKGDLGTGVPLPELVGVQKGSLRAGAALWRGPLPSNPLLCALQASHKAHAAAPKQEIPDKIPSAPPTPCASRACPTNRYLTAFNSILKVQTSVPNK